MTPAEHIAKNIGLLQKILQTMSELGRVSQQVINGGIGEGELE